MRVVCLNIFYIIIVNLKLENTCRVQTSSTARFRFFEIFLYPEYEQDPLATSYPHKTLHQHLLITSKVITVRQPKSLKMH